MQISLGAHGKLSENYQTEEVRIIQWLQLLSVVVMLILFVILKKRQLSLIVQVDQEKITPADFTLVMHNVHKSATREKLIEFLD